MMKFIPVTNQLESMLDVRVIFINKVCSNCSTVHHSDFLFVMKNTAAYLYICSAFNQVILLS